MEETVESVLAGVREQGGFAFCQLIRRSDPEAAHDMAWEQLHLGDWHQVHIAWRDAYALSCLLWARDLHRSEAMRVLDMGLMMGGLALRSHLNSAIASLQSDHDSAEASVDDRTDIGLETEFKSLPKGSLEGSIIKSIEVPSLEKFMLEHFIPGVPVILTGTMEHWPAMTRWKDFNYFLKVAGNRTVPVEVGETYLADGWKQELMTMSQFLCRLNGSPDPSRRAYLAQHPLFDQIPELQKDIITPDYCACGDGELQSVNAWFGPCGTITPLHYDPHHNLLAQVVGRKYIRLYSVEASESLYPFNEPMLQNSSQVDVDEPDYERFPQAKGLKFMDCVLREGEMLYIPPKWWHYVRSLSPSFSVSFWWRS